MTEHPSSTLETEVLKIKWENTFWKVSNTVLDTQNLEATNISTHKINMRFMKTFIETNYFQNTQFNYLGYLNHGYHEFAFVYTYKINNYSWNTKALN